MLPNANAIPTNSIAGACKIMSYYWTKLFTAWQENSLGSFFLIIIDATWRYVTSGVTAYQATLGGDVFVLNALCLCLFMDLILGILVAIKKREFTWTCFRHGAIKYPVIFIFIILAGVMVEMCERMVGVEMTVLFNFFMGYLVISEAKSILESLQTLKIKVPMPLSAIVFGMDNLTKTIFKKWYKSTDDKKSNKEG